MTDPSDHRVDSPDSQAELLTEQCIPSLARGHVENDGSSPPWRKAGAPTENIWAGRKGKGQGCCWLCWEQELKDHPAMFSCPAPWSVMRWCLTCWENNSWALSKSRELQHSHKALPGAVKWFKHQSEKIPFFWSAAFLTSSTTPVWWKVQAKSWR